MTPSVASEMFRTGNVKLAPPQFAEISGLARYDAMVELFYNQESDHINIRILIKQSRLFS